MIIIVYKLHFSTIFLKLSIWISSIISLIIVMNYNEQCLIKFCIHFNVEYFLMFRIKLYLYFC